MDVKPISPSEENKESRKAGRRKMALEHEAMTDRIIGAAIEVQRLLIALPAFLLSCFPYLSISARGNGREANLSRLQRHHAA
ncbi:MAG TPA: hypothetical protein VGY77_01815 [Gemmataceae bacterium]|nr:hypothetical protein [Gemmataceae bacterium]